MNKKKKTAHAYFGRLYFSKFFGGKIETFKQTLLTETFSIK